jgi:hypothetical protein
MSRDARPVARGWRIARGRKMAPGLGISLLLWSVLASDGGAAVSPTPTPRPRLTGGFGRPRDTTPPAPPEGGGQSLSDVVRAAREARERKAPPPEGGLTITNRSLVTDPEKGRLSVGRPQPTPHGTEPAPAPSGDAAPAGQSASGASAGSDLVPSPADAEAQWREKSRAARKRVADAKARVGELEAAAKKLENDFYAWDDGQYRDRVIKPAWDHARERLEDAKAELAEAEKELAGLPEKARRAGALPGWLRE